ncbi:MAG: hypothetical protein ACK5B9_02600 [Flavobacteriia bacterium]
MTPFEVTLNEHHIYGSARIGVENQNKAILNASQLIPETGNPGLPSQINIANANFDYSERIVGDKNYELANHLGNVAWYAYDKKAALKYRQKTDAPTLDPKLNLLLKGTRYNSVSQQL